MRLKFKYRVIYYTHDPCSGKRKCGIMHMRSMNPLRGRERESRIDRQITACSCTSLLSSCSLSMSCDKMWFITFTETNGHRHVVLSVACVSSMCVFRAAQTCACVGMSASHICLCLQAYVSKNSSTCVVSEEN